MAHYTAQAGLDDITGALTKNKRHRRLTVTRIKHIKNPVTGEEEGRGDDYGYRGEREEDEGEGGYKVKITERQCKQHGTASK